MPEDAVARISDLLGALSRSAEERVSLDAIGAALGRRQLGIIILCLALPASIPGPYLPGFSTLLAVPIIWLGARLVLGRGRAGLPRLLRRLTIGRERFIRFVDRATPWLVRIEGWIGHRPGFLTGEAGRRCLGAILILYAIVMALPVPFGNVPIGTAIVVIALGLIEDDSRALTIGVAIGVAGCLWQCFLIAVGIKAITLI